MERDVMLSHGVSQFLKERLMDSSDMFRIFIGRESNSRITANPDLGIYRYDGRELNPDEVFEAQLPYSMSLFSDELTSMGIDLRYIPAD
jgi:DNA-directed RNA polymerase beta subunit